MLETQLNLKYSFQNTIVFTITDDPYLSWIGNFDCKKYKRIFVVFDSNVKSIWGEKIIDKLQDHHKEIIVFSAKPEEKTKSIEFYPEILGFFEKHRCNLYDLVIAVGGGTILDLVSFFCSTYMRGLHLYAIPTTLIGQVDAITAGKTCLNTLNGKNILGTFYYPLEVYNNISILKTNQPLYSRQGFSEIFKYGLLASKELLETYDKYNNNKSEKVLIKIIELTIKARSIIRKKDALASNLGHTFGHALEKISNYEVLHGDAISVGTVMALYFALDRGLISQSKVDEIVTKMRQHGLNIYLDSNIDVSEMVNCMLNDKKSSVDTINLVLIRDIEKPYEKSGSLFFPVSPGEMDMFLNQFFKSYNYTKENCWDYLKKDYLEYT